MVVANTIADFVDLVDVGFDSGFESVVGCCDGFWVFCVCSNDGDFDVYVHSVGSGICSAGMIRRFTAPFLIAWSTRATRLRLSSVSCNSCKTS